MIQGVHDPVQYSKGPIWMVEALAVGHNRHDHSGHDYRDLAEQGHRVIVRLNEGWHPHGTIPLPAYYDDFAQRCANFAAATRGCWIYVIGNEWTNKIERPHGQVITAADYISCYNKVRAKIKAVRPDVWVVPAAVGNWNIETGDWLQLYWDVLSSVEADAICWHVYSHGWDPSLVTSDAKMASMPDRLLHFRCYQDFERYTPSAKRHLPVLVTEANGNNPWSGYQTGWITAAYEEIQHSSMDVQCLCLFRATATGDDWNMTPAAWSELDQLVEAGPVVPPPEPPPVEDPMGWKNVHVNNCEQGFHEQGDQHLTVVNGMTVHYIHGGEGHFPRPELKPKDKNAGQPEVFEGRYSQSGFYISSDGRFGLVSDPIFGEIGLRTKGSVMYMHVHSEPHFALGSRCGVIDGDGPFTAGPVWPLGGTDPFASAAIKWGEWRWTRSAPLDINLPQREWAKLTTPEIVLSGDYARLVVQFNVDLAANGSHGHWDAFTLQQYDESVDPDPDPDPGQPPVNCVGATPAQVQEIVETALSRLELRMT